ncbi:hypothetical protein DACRYDRAFT_23956 [Dacryopinax primogenitus]|uniref:Aminoglycoside phosphotransferase domain-containing protein n=1 Tax=Dacryopinax primogenitus (strain DJM 731) TaxID=1858805 RepID=M5FTK8_DACPD|nr:uncharacterized protein DACRYDRAFT_23956 [Dacryopinax primogenitus]EJT99428.1 hypothetical protein DACRYDRAFT_23956 [Dacryopinax primogenitus]
MPTASHHLAASPALYPSLVSPRPPTPKHSHSLPPPHLKSPMSKTRPPTRPTTPVSFSFSPTASFSRPKTPKQVQDFKYRGTPIVLDTWNPQPPLFPTSGSDADSPGEDDVFEREAMRRIVQLLFEVKEVTFDKAVEGTYNQIYIFRLRTRGDPNIPTSVLCRLSRPEKVQSLISMRSEVETMLYVRDRMSVPIPQVYGYSTSLALLGTTFIIMQHVTNAVPLTLALPTLSPLAKDELAKQYARIIFQLSQMRFLHIGSVRQDKTAGNFGVGSMSLFRTDRMARMTTSSYRSVRRSFPSVREWAEAMERWEMRFLEEHPELVEERFERSGDAAVKRANEAMSGIVHALPHVGAPDAVGRTFCLWHPELNATNIMVRTQGPEEGQIVAIIDWEGAAILPLYMLCKLPDFFPSDAVSAARFDSVCLYELDRLDPKHLLSQAADGRYEGQRTLVEAVLKPWWEWEGRERWLEEWSRGRNAGKGVPLTTGVGRKMQRSWTIGWGGGLKKRSQTM